MTSHFWFRSGSHTLLAHLDEPENRRAEIGVVMVPPFGWNEVCSYRPLRFLARDLADAGIATLRYDLPGTGDSSGNALDEDLLESWIRSVSAALKELQESSGVRPMAILGVQLGALLALAASARAGIRADLVLWGVPSSGRALLRELRASARMESWEYLSAEEAPPPPVPGFESGGFLLSHATVNDLEALDLAQLAQPAASRILLLGRDGVAADAKLREALLASGTSVEVADGDGYAGMTALPHEAVPSPATHQRIADFLGRTQPHGTVQDVPRETVQPSANLESIHSIGIGARSSQSKMFGILSEPAGGSLARGPAIIYLNAGGVRHIGPNRMWVESARRWSERGVTSLRLDLASIGESDGDPVLDVPALYQESLVEQVHAAVGWVRDRTRIPDFILIGLCAGAFWAFHSALRYPEVRAAVMLNPRLLFWDAQADQRRLVRRAIHGFTRPQDWLRLLRGGVQAGDLKRMLGKISAGIRGRADNGSVSQMDPAALIPRAWSRLERHGKKVTLVFREGEPLFDELQKGGLLPGENSAHLKCMRVLNGGHTFRPIWAQALAHEIIDAEISALIQNNARANLQRAI